MSPRPQPNKIEILQDTGIKARMAAWLDYKGDVYCYTRMPVLGNLEAVEHPPSGLSHGVIVNPSDYEDFLKLIGLGGIKF